jgi:outer membrane lipoprotein-sorting protein
MKDLSGRKSFCCKTVLLCLFALALGLTSTILGCGGGGTSSEVENLVDQAAAAGDKIVSYHMNLSMYFDYGKSDRIRTEELVIDINGNDVALKDTFYDPDTGQGTLIQEIVRVGGKQYSKDLKNNEWAEEQPTAIEEAATTYTSHISDFVNNSTSVENLGEEQVNGVDAVHLRFQLSPQNVVSLLPSTPQSNLESNSGGQVDIWIDSDNYYPVRYEMLFRNVVVGEGMGNVNVLVTINITDINKVIEIKVPI